MLSASHALELEFWRYAITTYGRDGVPEILLDWQEKQGANVNAILLCLWSAGRGRSLAAGDLKKAAAAVSGWHAAAVVPLRELRRRLKVEWSPLAPQSETVRQAVLAAELAAERAEQAVMIEALAPWPEPKETVGDDLARQNLLAYLESADAAALADLLTRIG